VQLYQALGGGFVMDDSPGLAIVPEGAPRPVATGASG